MSIQTYLNEKLNTRWRRYLFVPFALYTPFLLLLTGWFIFYAFLEPNERVREDAEPEFVLTQKAQECLSRHPDFYVSDRSYPTSNEYVVDVEELLNPDGNLLMTSSREGQEFRKCAGINSAADAFDPNPNYPNVQKVRYVTYGNRVDDDVVTMVFALFLSWALLCLILLPPRWMIRFVSWLNMKD